MQYIPDYWFGRSIVTAVGHFNTWLSLFRQLLFPDVDVLNVVRMTYSKVGLDCRVVARRPSPQQEVKWKSGTREVKINNLIGEGRSMKSDDEIAFGAAGKSRRVYFGR